MIGMDVDPQDQDYRFNLSAARSMLAGGLSTLAMLGAAAEAPASVQAFSGDSAGIAGAPFGEPLGASETDAMAVEASKCGPNSNTLICNYPPSQAVAYCIRAMRVQSPEGFKGQVQGGNKFRLSFVEPNVAACAPVVTREVSYYAERVAADGTTTRISPVGSNKDLSASSKDNAYKVNRTLGITPTDCAAPGMTGSKVEGVVVVDAVPRKGWPQAGKHHKVSFFSKPTPVC